MPRTTQPENQPPEKNQGEGDARSALERLEAELSSPTPVEPDITKKQAEVGQEPTTPAPSAPQPTQEQPTKTKPETPAPKPVQETPLKQQAATPASTQSDRGGQQKYHTPPLEQNTSTQAQKEGPAPIAQQGGEKQKPSESAIRTYYSDVAEIVNKSRISQADIAVAESRRREKQGAVLTSPKKTGWGAVFITIGIILLVAGGGIIGYLFATSSPIVSPRTQTVLPDALIPVEHEEKLDVTDISGEAFRRVFEQQLAELTPPSGEITVLTLTEIRTRTEDFREKTVPLPARDFIELLGTRADAPLLRSIEADYLLGVYNDGGTQTPFLILSTSFFENAFAGMLRWEPFIAHDMPFLVHTPKPEPTAPIATTTHDMATSTLSATEASTSTEVSTTSVPTLVPQEPPVWRDRVIANRDTRVLEDAQGNILLIYSFPTQDTLILTGTVETLTEIFDRLTEVQFQ